MSNELFQSPKGWRAASVATTDKGLEKPQNGLAGLKHFRDDVSAGIIVSLVSLPLSSGIAIASGAPPVYGLISAIIAGLVFPFIGGGFLTIAGPAAGLAPALLAIMASLGGAGDAEHIGEGYRFLLVVIFMVGCLQILISLFKLTRYCSIVPTTVVEGIMTSIGWMIIATQLPGLFGYTEKMQGHSFIKLLSAIPNLIQHMTVPVFAVSFASLSLLFLLGMFKESRILQVAPPQLIAVVIGTILGRLFQIEKAGPGFLIALPNDTFQVIIAPAFTELLARSDLWFAAFLGVTTLTILNGVQSLATAMTIDRLDPYERKSKPNRILLAMGIANIASSLAGGLTVIPGGVKSRLNVALGGKTLWSNFTTAICLGMYLVFAKDLIHQIPKGVLAALLIYTGWKMCEPILWNQLANIEAKKLCIFLITVVVSLLTDLLSGIIAGVGASFIVNMLLYRNAILASNLPADERPTLFQCVHDFFSNPVFRRQMENEVYSLHLDKPLVCFNGMKLSRELDRIPTYAKQVDVHLDDHIPIIDHKSRENLVAMIQDYSHVSIPVNIFGPAELTKRSGHEGSNPTHHTLERPVYCDVT